MILTLGEKMEIKNGTFAHDWPVYGRLDAFDCTAIQLASHMRSIEHGANGNISIKDNAYDYDIDGWLDSVTDGDGADVYVFDYYAGVIKCNGRFCAKWSIARADEPEADAGLDAWRDKEHQSHD
jgi:hypothetical protein